MNKYEEILKLVQKYASAIASVEFIKADGSERELQFSWADTVARSAPHTGPDHILTVYDLEADGWRKVNMDRVYRVSVAGEDRMWTL